MRRVPDGRFDKPPAGASTPKQLKPRGQSTLTWKNIAAVSLRGGDKYKQRERLNTLCLGLLLTVSHCQNNRLG